MRSKKEKLGSNFSSPKATPPPPPPQKSQATVYKMEVFSKVGMLCKSLDLLREMQGQLIARHDEAHTKITEILVQILRNRTCWYLVDMMTDFVNSGLKTLAPSYVLWLSLHDKWELELYQCLEKCPNSANKT
ncbi:hypothetical protein S83_070258 [Arachis hypogaea]